MVHILHSSAPCLSSGTATVTSSVAVSLRTCKLCSIGGLQCREWVTCTSRQSLYYTLFFIPFCFVYWTIALFERWRRNVFKPAVSSVAAGDSLAALHESEWDFQITSHVCFTLLAKPDGWSSTQATNTRKFRQSWNIFKNNPAYFVIDNIQQSFFAIIDLITWKYFRLHSGNLFLI